jgi:SAM-dependent methyltransferase
MAFGNVKEILKRIEKLYSENMESHGCNSRSVGWKDRESQNLRFEKLVQVIDVTEHDRVITVNDWGCGYGEMFKYLDALPDVNLKTYYGYDISKEMLCVAREYVRDDRAEWINSEDIGTVADYSFACGIFNVRFEANNDIWTEYIQEAVMQMARMSRRGLAFNSLSKYVDWKEDHLYYGDPLFFFDFCKRNISRNVSLLHDYELFEWTLTVRK